MPITGHVGDLARRILSADAGLLVLSWSDGGNVFPSFFSCILQVTVSICVYRGTYLCTLDKWAKYDCSLLRCRWRFWCHSCSSGWWCAADKHRQTKDRPLSADRLYTKKNITQRLFHCDWCDWKHRLTLDRRMKNLLSDMDCVCCSVIVGFSEPYATINWLIALTFQHFHFMHTLCTNGTTLAITGSWKRSIISRLKLLVDQDGIFTL